MAGGSKSGTDIFVRKSLPGSQYGEGYMVEIYDGGVKVSEEHVNTKKDVDRIISEQKARYNTNRAFQNELYVHVEYKDEEKSSKGASSMNIDNILLKKAAVIGELLSRFEDPSIPHKVYAKEFLGAPEQGAAQIDMGDLPTQDEVVEELKTKIVSFYSGGGATDNNSYNELKQWLADMNKMLKQAIAQGAPYDLKAITSQLKSIFEGSGLPGEEDLFKSASTSYLNAIKVAKDFDTKMQEKLPSLWNYVEHYQGTDTFDNVFSKWASISELHNIEKSYIKESAEEQIAVKLKTASISSIEERVAEDFFRPVKIALLLQKFGGEEYLGINTDQVLDPSNLVNILTSSQVDPVTWFVENSEQTLDNLKVQFLNVGYNIEQATQNSTDQSFEKFVISLFMSYIALLKEAINNNPQQQAENSINTASAVFFRDFLKKVHSIIVQTISEIDYTAGDLNPLSFLADPEVLQQAILFCKEVSAKNENYIYQIIQKIQADPNVKAQAVNSLKLSIVQSGNLQQVKTGITIVINESAEEQEESQSTDENVPVSLPAPAGAAHQSKAPSTKTLIDTLSA